MIFTVIMYRSNGYHSTCSCCQSETSNSDFALDHFVNAELAIDWWAEKLAEQLEEAHDSPEYDSPEFTLLVGGVPEDLLDEDTRSVASSIRQLATQGGHQYHETWLTKMRLLAEKNAAQKAEEVRIAKEENERRKLAELQAKYGSTEQ